MLNGDRKPSSVFFQKACLNYWVIFVKEKKLLSSLKWRLALSVNGFNLNGINRKKSAKISPKTKSNLSLDVQ